MPIAGVPDDTLERLHSNFGHGRGAIGYRHRPSGLIVMRECPAGVPIRRSDAGALAELAEQLRAAGLASE